MLRRENIEVEGKRAVVIGRSDIVGKPMAMLLTHANATVTVCHSRTKDLPALAREGEILVAAMGRPAMIRKEFIREGAVVVDVGMNRAETLEQVKDFFGDGRKASTDVRETWLDPRGRCASQGCDGSRIGFYPGARRRGPSDDRHAASNTLELAKARRG